MKQANPCNPGTVQQPPADLSEQAPGGPGKPRPGNVAEPPVPNARLIDLRSGKGDRRVNPSRRTE